jgi:hypothetical protein
VIAELLKRRKMIDKNNYTREEIIRIVREGNKAVVWITDRGAIVSIPTSTGLYLLAGEDETFFDDFVPWPIVIVHGVKGLSATDPYWDGSETFYCPDCKQMEDSDLNTHNNLWWYEQDQKEKKLSKNKLVH